jgi:bifunctional UDP-N-acetylglucosamine pyrophosphorylase/glucosamine-1-phosphate N-acetyltransferase
MENLKLNYYFEHIDEFEYKELFDNCTYPWEALAKVTPMLEEKVVKPDLKINNGHIGEFVSIQGNYIIGEGTQIHSNVSIEGPVIIGKNVTIQSGALIRPGCVIGDNCVIGHGAEIKHSIIQNKAKVQSLTFAGDSIIGKSTRVGSGTILSNRRFDQKNITIKNSQGEKVDVGTDFFGAIVGDNSRLGANCTTLPGSFIGAYTWILPTVQIRGFVPSEKRVFPVQSTRIEENPRLELK